MFSRALVSGFLVPSAQPGKNKHKNKSRCRKQLIFPTNTFHTIPHYSEDDDGRQATPEPFQNKKQNGPFAPKVQIMDISPSESDWTSNSVCKPTFQGVTTQERNRAGRDMRGHMFPHTNRAILFLNLFLVFFPWAGTGPVWKLMKARLIMIIWFESDSIQPNILNQHNQSQHAHFQAFNAPIIINLLGNVTIAIRLRVVQCEPKMILIFLGWMVWDMIIIYLGVF